MQYIKINAKVLTASGAPTPTILTLIISQDSIMALEGNKAILKPSHYEALCFGIGGKKLGELTLLSSITHFKPLN